MQNLEAKKMTKLDIKLKKLARLEREKDQLINDHIGVIESGNGQPMNDKGAAGQRWINNEQKAWERANAKNKEYQEYKQEVDNFIDNQNKLDEAAKQGIKLNRNLTVATSVENIEHLEANAHSTYDRKRLKQLKAIKEKSENDQAVMSDQTKQLIADGKITQWAKKPIYYFVKGLRKAAVVIDENGNVKSSNNYPVSADELKKLLN